MLAYYLVPTGLLSPSPPPHDATAQKNLKKLVGPNLTLESKYIPKYSYCFEIFICWDTKG